MGASLSTQEDLFVSQRWAELLEEAMVADMEAVGGEAGGGGKKKGSEFRMSFKEWQAFLGILEAGARSGTGKGITNAELQQAGSAPSTICDQLLPAQLHCPLVPLAVHAFALWVGAIDHSTFRMRLERLEDLVTIDEDGEVMERLEENTDDDDGAGRNDGDGRQVQQRSTATEDATTNDDEEDYFGDSDVADENPLDPPDPPAPPPPPPPPSSAPAATEKPSSKRQQFFNAVKSRVAAKKGLRDAAAHAPAGTKKEKRTLLLLDEYVELGHLLYNLSNELIRRGAEASCSHPSGGSNGDGSGEATAVPFHAAHSPKMRATYRDLKNANTKSRPVARVALCVGLAIYAALAPTPLYSVDGVVQLRELDRAMQGVGDKDDEPSPSTGSAVSRGRGDGQRDGTAEKQDQGTDVGEASRAREPVTQQWPWVASLEAALVRKQHELDAQQCLGEDGKQLTRDLRTMRRNRLVAESEKKSGEAATRFAAMPPAERWAYCQSQYIGQRHIWGPLASHFLSADIFDADKPTVMIFFGPSGYGKSELAKQVASAVHGCPVKDLEVSGKMIYIHMPSFTTKESIYSLIDPPAAHVGDGILLSALHQHPDAVVVLDEFEKSTADAVQNVWLSAFQKNGVLRSLKRADRSISTVKATFILTCNIAADTIEREADRYLAASSTAQVRMRHGYQDVCKDVCRATFGDPFVNRVDSFHPFTAYNRIERQDYVELTLERLLAAQENKSRRVHVTPRCVAALVSKLKTFHASTMEEVLRPLLVNMSQRKWTEAVLTVQAHAVARDSGDYSHYVLLPCSAGGGSTADGEEADVWESLPDGPACLAQWHLADRESGPTGDAAAPPDTAAAAGSAAPGRHPIPTQAGGGDGTGPGAHKPPPTTTTAGERELERETTTEKDTATLTERELTLTRELERMRALLWEKDKEIATLKEKVLMLEKLLAVMMCVVLCCTMSVYLLIGWKLTFALLACTMGVVTLVLRIPLRILLDALGAFFRFLGPAKSAILFFLMSAWVFQASKGMRC